MQVHVVALFGVGLMALRTFRFASVAGALFLIGIILFSGSLYAPAFIDIPNLGMVAPFGGLSFMLGWIVISLSGLLGEKE